jgi:rare lipoprotein A
MRALTVPALALLVVVLTLAGCASTPKGSRAVASGSSGSGRPGGYYQDDGPGDNPPANLDQLPDAVPRVEPYLSGPNRAYNVFGRDYVPDTSDRPFLERGIASWYGRKFNGQKTSSGEIYDMYAMTAAHPTLPIPSYARVTNPANGRSVIVRINDRGPFHPGRVIDLSFAAAYRLGYTNVGSTSVEVERLLPVDIAAGRFNSGTAVALARAPTPAPTPAPLVVAPSPNPAPVQTPSAAQATPTTRGPTPLGAPSTAGTTALATDLPPDLVPAEYLTQGSADSTPIAASSGPEGSDSGHYLQLAAFKVRSGAEGFLQHLTRELDPALATRLRITNSESFFRVQLGPYAQRSEAEGAALRLRDDLGLASMIVTPH